MPNWLNQGGYEQGNPYSDAAAWSQDNMYELMGGLRDRAQSGHPLYGAGNDFAQGQLNGQSQNPYLDQVFQNASNLNIPGLDQYTQMLLGQMSGGGMGMGGGGSSFYGGGGGGTPQQGPVGAADYIKQMLDGQYLGPEGSNPHRDQMIDSLTGRIQEEYAEKKIPGMNIAAGGAGRFGGRAWANAMGEASQSYTDALADAVTQVEYGEYERRMADRQAALGMGSQMDMNYTNASASMANAAASAGASRYGADAALQRAQLQALGDAFGLQGQLGMAGLGMQGDMAQLMSSDQNFALGMIPELSGLDIRDMMAAIQPGMDLAQMENQQNVARINNRPALLNHDFNVWRYGREAPWMDLMNYSNLMNSFGAGGGSSHQFGTSPGALPDPWGQAIQGGLAGYGMGQQWGGGG